MSEEAFDPEARTRRTGMLIAVSSVVVIAVVGALTVIGGSANAPVAPVDSAAPATTSDSVANEPPTTAQPPPPAPDFSAGFSARGMLAMIPFLDVSPGGGFIVEGTDFAAISEMTGVARAGDVDLSAPPSEWFDLLFVQDSIALADSMLLITAVQAPDDFKRELDFSFLGVDRFATVSNYLGFSVTDELALPFDVVALRSDMAALAGEAGNDRIVDVGGGADGEMNTADRTPVRPLGRPLRVGVDEQRSMISVSKSTPLVTAWLDAESPTLADVPDLATAAAALDRNDGLYSARLDIFDRDLANFAPPGVGDRPDSDFLILEEFTTVGVSWSGVGDEQLTTIVYVFADQAAAAASVEPIETLYAPTADARNRDGAGLDGIATVGEVFVLDEVTTVGRAVVVSGHAADDRGPAEARRLLIGIGPLSAHR